MANGIPDELGRLRGLRLFAAAFVLTAANAAKPVHEDDVVYLAYAAEFAAHPLDPYAFSFGSPLALPANNTLVPPVLPYWLGAGWTLFGDNPIALKFWLAPFALLLVWAVDALVARTAPTLRAPVFWLALVSPTIVPGFNLMLDVPAAALGVAAVAVALRALDRDSVRLAALAGVAAGLAVQTKYTGAVAGAVVVLLFVAQRRFVFALVAGAFCALIVVGWELLIAEAQGDSHFLIHFRMRQGKPAVRGLHLLLPLVSHTAALAPAIALLAAAALGRSRRFLITLGLVVAGGIAILALVPARTPLLISDDGKPRLTGSNLVYGMMALAVWPPLVGSCWRIARRSSGNAERFLDRLLFLWLVLELLGYFALSPFPAARRLTGPLLVLTLLVGRLAHRHGVPRALAQRIAVFGMVLTLVFQAADVCDARATHAAACQLTRTAHAPADGGTYWHLTWIGVAYAADREGLRPLQLNRQMPRQGDLLAVHDLPELRSIVQIQKLFDVELLETVATGDGFPLRAAPGYYDGRTPLEHNGGERVRVLIYRITAVHRMPE